MTSREPTVFVVDDDAAMRRSLDRLLRSVQLRVELFVSAQAFLDAFVPETPGCLVLDVRMPGMSGLELQKLLIEMGNPIPVIIVTGHGDVPMAVRAVKAGALDFIEKPFRAQVLLDRISEAFRMDEQSRARRVREAGLARRVALLTPREIEVFRLLARGRSGKQIALELGISHKTVQVHRSHVFEKLGAETEVDLVRYAQVGGSASTRSLRR